MTNPLHSPPVFSLAFWLEARGQSRSRQARLLTIAVALIAALLNAFPASAETADVQTTWQLLDYIAVDYGGAVDNGAVISQSEFAEMNEFAGTAAAQLASLPPKPERRQLIGDTTRLRALIAAKGSHKDVVVLAHHIAADLLKAYPVPLAPKNAPNVSRGTTLFAQNCASCHGMSGNGQGPDAGQLATPPVAFTDRERARQRSLFALQQVISNGIEGTAMPSFSALPATDRWSLAFKAGGFAFPEALAHQGEKIWKSDPDVRKQIPDLKALVAITPATLASIIGQVRADAVIAYLRRHPEVLSKNTQSSSALAIVRSKLADSVSAYRAGDHRLAKKLALATYLDGFEPIEPVLGARDSTLMAHIERNMGEFRAAISKGVPVNEVVTKAAVLDALFDDADRVLTSDAGSGVTTYVGAFTVLLREGLEALLIVIAMFAFLDKAERRDALIYVHWGWVGALIAGAVTWVVATYAIAISGASRELTEGFGSILAAIVLLSVGIWMHGKSQAGEWQRYIGAKFSKALDRKSGWFLFALAFVVVYREVFETILFYAALWAQGSGVAMLAGAGTAVLVLGTIAWVMLHYSRKLPITTFFKYSSWLMVILTVVLAGKGVGALQEAGLIGISPIMELPRISIVGFFPTIQSILAQFIAVAALTGGFVFNRLRRSIAM
ncbi:MAG: FTR1 family protein [Alphaproteobacteria bacterium]|nr:FTR1 family protein [Alphaproteobacteria bacterium]